MSHSIQKCNGITVEQINGKVFVNGRNVETGELKTEKAIFCGVFGFGFLVGFIVALLV